MRTDARDLLRMTLERRAYQRLERGQLIGLIQVGRVEEAVVAAQAKHRGRAGQAPEHVGMHVRREMRGEFRDHGSHPGQRLRNIDMTFSGGQP